MWEAKLIENLNKVVLDSDTKEAYYLDYVQGEDGIYLSKKHIMESGMSALDLADVKSSLDNQNQWKKPKIFISDEI